MSAEKALMNGNCPVTGSWVANGNFILRDIAGDCVLVLIGNAPDPRLENCMISINETGAFLWKLFEQGPITAQQAIEAAKAEFTAPDGVIEQQIHEFIKSYVELGMLLKEE